jgi:DNA repair exonuclease SbcCD ATPase subunit
MARGRRGADRQDCEIAQLRTELELLREENTRLRIERSRIASAADQTERLRERLETLQQVEEEADEAWQVLTDSHVLRDTLLQVVGDIERTMALARHQLLSATPATELDRRLIDRRDDERPADAACDRAVGANGRTRVLVSAPTRPKDGAVDHGGHPSEFPNLEDVGGRGRADAALRNQRIEG